ncbi:MAG: T9SS type A sorting domain-containing protein [Aquabacterium sp.]|nr:T9SS type A sorting domain-containing protein [Ferruginibacter sp.]
MIKCLPIVFLCCSIQMVTGQITTPVIKANFGIEADLSSNYFNGTTQLTGDDWFSIGYTGSGQFVIDTTGAAAILAAYISNPATRNKSFSRLMRQAPYTVVNNKLLLDAVFHRDYHGDDSTVFASGSNKNGMTPAMWSCPVSQGIPDKNDILDTYTHVRRDGPNATDSLWMFGGLSLENTTGSRYFDFELYQTDIVYNRSTSSFQGYGPDAGHTSWKFDAAGNIISPGDIIFTAEFSSSSLTLVEARIWVNRTATSIAPVTFKWAGDFDGDGSGATYGYANILPKTAGTFYSGIQSNAATWAGSFALVRVDNSVVNTYLARQFMEFSVNLTKLGIEPASFSNNACGSPFRRVLIKSRASTSFTAELKDFVAPYRMFDYPKVDAYASTIYYCGSMPSATIEVFNPIGTSLYNWTTTNGNIVGPANGTSINVNAAGTYYVTQQLHSQCPTFAKDSVTILYDAVCKVLNVQVTDFTVDADGVEGAIRWNANNNEGAASYMVEFSTDNKIFKNVKTVPASNQPGSATYNLQTALENTGTVTFYRIKIIEKNGAVKYSNTVVIRNSITATSAPFIFPNPAKDEVWLSLVSPTKTSLNIFVNDIAGRYIKTVKVNVNQGANLISLHQLALQPAGVYIINIAGNNATATQKLMLKK